MTTRLTRWSPGTPCWADLTAPDMASAKPFYAAVLGWAFRDFGEEYGGYAIATKDGVAAAGLGPAAEGWPHVWTLYLASDDADATAGAVTAAGGRVLFGPDDVGPLGRMVLAADPTGASFGVWQAKAHIGAGIVNAPGGLTWEDLRSTDPDAARAFYAQVFGWTYAAVDMAGPAYTTFHPAEGRPELGGLGDLMGLELPSHWLVYFGVADTDAAVAAATDHGGRVVVPAFDSPFGRLAALADPAGATFMVIAVS